MVFGWSGRRSIKIALFVEDKIGKKAIEILAHKITARGTSIKLRFIKRGGLLNEQKVYSFIKNDILQDHPDVSKIIACVDSECTLEEEIEKEVQKVKGTLTVKVNRPVYYVVVVHALEGWLLSDPEGIKKYLGPRAKINISPSASKECRPKKVMKDIFRKAGKDYLHTIHNSQIAELSDPKKIIKSNPSFKNFYEVIKDP